MICLFVCLCVFVRKRKPVHVYEFNEKRLKIFRLYRILPQNSTITILQVLSFLVELAEARSRNISL